MRIGIHEDPTATPKGRTPAEVLAKYPKSQIGRGFSGSPPTTVQDLRPKMMNVIQPYLDSGTKVIYYSVKTDIAQTRAGNWNARYAELGAKAADVQRQYGVQVIIIPWHEPEDNFSSGTAFVHYANKVREHIKLGSNGEVAVKPCFMAYHWAPGSAGSIAGKTNNPGEWFGGLNMDDGVTIDVYSGRSFPLEQTLMEHPGFSRFISLLPNTVRWSVTERGWETPSSTNSTNRSALRVSTMEREFNWLLSPGSPQDRCDDYIIWSSPGTEGAAGLVMDQAAEDKISEFLERASTPVIVEPEPTTPDPSHPQYIAGYEAGQTEGYEAGLAEGRNAAFAETHDWAASRIQSV